VSRKKHFGICSQRAFVSCIIQYRSLDLLQLYWLASKVASWAVGHRKGVERAQLQCSALELHLAVLLEPLVASDSL
jgi:hypothetical protein